MNDCCAKLRRSQPYSLIPLFRFPFLPFSVFPFSLFPFSVFLFSLFLDLCVAPWILRVKISLKFFREDFFSPTPTAFFVAKEGKLHKLKSTVTEDDMACLISDLRYIQELSGHNSSKTTEIYTYITQKGIDKIISPFDHIRKK